MTDEARRKLLAAKARKSKCVCPNPKCGHDAPDGQIRHEEQIKVDAVRSWFEPCSFCGGKGEVEADCGECLDSGEKPDGESCQACCDHEFDPDEGFMCLNCDKEGLEDAMCAAFDRCEGDR